MLGGDVETMELLASHPKVRYSRPVRTARRRGACCGARSLLPDASAPPSHAGGLPPSQVDIHALNKFGCAAVQWAAAAGNVSTCRWLMSKGVSFEHVNHVRHGALNKAAVKGHVEAVRWLLYAEDGPKLISQLLLLDLEGRTVADLCYLMRQDAVGAWLDGLIAAHRHAAAEGAKGDVT